MNIEKFQPKHNLSLEEIAQIAIKKGMPCIWPYTGSETRQWNISVSHDKQPYGSLAVCVGLQDSTISELKRIGAVGPDNISQDVPVIMLSSLYYRPLTKHTVYNNATSIVDRLNIASSFDPTDYKLDHLQEVFERTFTVARALSGISQYIPNFMYAVRNEIYQAKSGNIETLLIPMSGFFNKTAINLEHAIASFHLEPWEFLSAYMQVVSACSYANTHTRFVHNALHANAVTLHKYAKVFTVNYDEKAVICFKYMAIIGCYQSAQITFVSDCATVELPPNSSINAYPAPINLTPLVSSDIYTFTCSCLLTFLEALSKLSRDDCRINKYAAVTNFLFSVVGVFIGNRSATVSNMQSWPSNIRDIRSGAELIHNMTSLLKTSGISVTIDTAPTYGNIHILPHPKISIHSLDLRSLCIPHIYSISRDSKDYITCMENFDDMETDIDCNYTISVPAHIAYYDIKKIDSQTLRNSVTEKTYVAEKVSMLIKCMTEFPAVMFLSRALYASIATTPIGRALIDKFVADCNMPIYVDYDKNEYILSDLISSSL